MPARGSRTWLVKMATVWLTRQRYEALAHMALSRPSLDGGSAVMLDEFVHGADIEERLRKASLSELRSYARLAERELGKRKSGRRPKDPTIEDWDLLLDVRDRRKSISVKQ